MRFTTAEEAKKWLRGLPLLKKEWNMKTAFYQDLIRDSEKMGEAGGKYIAYYEGQIAQLQEEIRNAAETLEKILNLLNPEERMVLTARYVKGVPWDIIELHVHYSRRQAIRIHNQAIERLIGREIGAVAA